MRTLVVFLLAVTICESGFAQTHCRPGETVYFSCRISGKPKVVSLCGSKADSIRRLSARKDAWLQYRFGVPGKLELVLPKRLGGSVNSFKHEFHHGLQTLWIESNAASYTIFSGTNVETEEHFHGVSVDVGKRAVQLKCAEETQPQGNFYGLVYDLEYPKHE
jgi:hypothetical protein